MFSSYCLRSLEVACVLFILFAIPKGGMCSLHTVLRSLEVACVLFILFAIPRGGMCSLHTVLYAVLLPSYFIFEYFCNIELLSSAATPSPADQNVLGSIPSSEMGVLSGAEIFHRSQSLHMFFLLVLSLESTSRSLVIIEFEPRKEEIVK